MIDWQRDKKRIIVACVLGVLIVVSLAVNIPRMMKPEHIQPYRKDVSSFVVTWQSLSRDATMRAPAGPGPKTDPETGADDMYVSMMYQNPQSGRRYRVWLQYELTDGKYAAKSCRFKDGPWMPILDLENDRFNPCDPRTGESLVPMEAIESRKPKM